MSSLRPWMVFVPALLLSACAIDKAPNQPPRKVESSSQPAAAKAAPAPEENAQVASIPVAEEQPMQVPAAPPKQQLLVEAEMFAFQLKAANSMLQSSARALPEMHADSTKIQRKLLELAKGAPWQSDQDLYMELLRNDLLLFVRDEKGRGIYHWLAMADQVDMARALIRAHLTYNLKTFDRDRRQPLHFARSKAMAKLLIDAGNDSQAADANGRIPLEAMLEREEIAPIPSATLGLCDSDRGIRRFFYAAPINVPGAEGKTVLQRAAAHGNVEAISSILSCPETNIMVTDRDRRTALHIAACARNESYAAAYALIAHFNSRAHNEGTLADFLGARDKDGETAQSLASKCGNSGTAALLGYFQQ